MKLSTIRSGKGDCIHIRFFSDRFYNLIIDTGSTASAAEYRKLVNSILLRGESIDMLIISHYDDDHIGGALKVADIPYKSVYFNAYNGKLENENLSALQNQRLFHLLPTSIVHTQVIANDVISIGGAKITIHSPTEVTLHNAKVKMVEADELLSSVSDWKFSFDELMVKEYPASDISVSNSASLVFTFEYDGKRILFCGDSWVENIPDGSFNLVKLPHHGSIRNINDDLLSRLDCHSFLICADGTRHPNKQTIAKLISHYGEITVYSNYEWWTKGFLKNEDMKYIESKRLILKKGSVTYEEI